MNAQDALAALGQTNPNHSGQSPNMNFQLPYGYGMGGYFSSFPSGVPIETQEQYQQFLLQQQHHLRMMEQYSRENRDEDITSPKRSRSKTTPMSIPTYNPNYTGRFILVEQPNIRQRKSYKNENRYILPNPLTICAKDDTNEKLPRILDGDVTVSLVNAEGHELPLGKQNLLEAPEGGLRQQLDTNFSAHFSLKVNEIERGLTKRCWTLLKDRCSDCSFTCCLLWKVLDIVKKEFSRDPFKSIPIARRMQKVFHLLSNQSNRVRPRTSRCL